MSDSGVGETDISADANAPSYSYAINNTNIPKNWVIRALNI